MKRKSYKTVLRMKGIRPIKIERTVKRDGDVELLPVRGVLIHRAPSPMADLIDFGKAQAHAQLLAQLKGSIK